MAKRPIPPPLRARLRALGVSNERLAADLTAAGFTITADSLRNVIDGRKAPSRDLADLLAKALGLPFEVVRGPHEALEKIRPYPAPPPAPAPALEPASDPAAEVA